MRPSMLQNRPLTAHSTSILPHPRIGLGSVGVIPGAINHIRWIYSLYKVQTTETNKMPRPRGKGIMFRLLVVQKIKFITFFEYNT